MPRWLNYLTAPFRWMVRPRTLMVFSVIVSYLQRTPQQEMPELRPILRRNELTYGRVNEEFKRWYGSDRKFSEYNIVESIDKIFPTKLSDSTFNKLLKQQNKYRLIPKNILKEGEFAKNLNDVIFKKFKAGYFLKIPAGTDSIVIQSHQVGESVTLQIKPQHKISEIPKNAIVISLPKNQNLFVKCEANKYCNIYQAEKDENSKRITLGGIEIIGEHQIPIASLLTVLTVRDCDAADYPDHLVFVNEEGEVKQHRIFQTVQNALFKDGESLKTAKNGAVSNDVRNLLTNVHKLLRKFEDNGWFVAKEKAMQPLVELFKNLANAQNPEQLKISYKKINWDPLYKEIPGIKKEVGDFIRDINNAAANLEKEISEAERKGFPIL